MLSRPGKLIASLAVAGGMLAGSCATQAADEAAPTAVADQEMVIAAVRRLTETQYRHAIADTFGDDVEVKARFEPDPRLDGLLAIGANEASISASGFQQYFAAASSIAEQVLDEEARAAQLQCAPVDATLADDACAASFLADAGRQLYRRPLAEEELAAKVAIARDGAADTGDFYEGLKLGLVSLLVSPEFLFRVERGTPTEDGVSLDAYSRAARISFLMWDAPPDEQLMEAAETGELMTQAGLAAQVERLAASPRVQEGVRAFFADLMQLDLFETLNKDAAQYPIFSQAVASSAREQTLKVLVDHLAVKRGDYRDIFTTRDTFINRPLGAVYRVPFASNEEWVPYTFDEDTGHSGVLTQISFMSLFSHPGRSSPTKRGAALREIFLCQTVPQPPADVDLSALNDDKSHATTVRERLELHRTEQLCATCHALTDPQGLAFEQFDGIGQRRYEENGMLIDVNVNFGGKDVSGARGIGEALREDPLAPACLVNRVWAYGHGRPSNLVTEREILAGHTEGFAETGYQVPELMAAMAMSEDFYKVPVEEQD